MNAKPLPPAVILGLSPTGLHVVRALGRAGVNVSGISQGVQAGNQSKYLDKLLIEKDPARKLAWLIENFSDDPKAVLIPTSDQDIDFIIDHAEILGDLFHFQGSYKDKLARKIMDKDSFYDLCEKHNVKYPKLWKTTLADLPELESQVSYPCLIKPSRIQDIKTEMAGKKGWTIKDAQDFANVTASIPKGAGTLLVQEIIPGPESNITLWCGYVCKSGQVMQNFTARKLRQYPPGFGSASMAQSHTEPDSAEIAEKFLRDVSYHGIAAAEFKRDPKTHELKIIEINVRPSLWFSLSSASDRHPVLAAYHALAGTEQDVENRPQSQAVRWIYGLKDIWSSTFYKISKNFILPPPNVNVLGGANKKTWAVYSPDDMRPLTTELFNFTRKMIARIIK